MGILTWISKLAGSKPNLSTPQVLYFKDDLSAFEYACKYQHYEIIKDEFLPCFVDAVSIPPDGNAVAAVRIPSEGPEARMIAALLNSRDCKQLEGKLCLAVVGDFVEILGVPSLMIVAELSPELDLATNWKIQRRL